MRRFFVTPEQIHPDHIEISGSDYNHLIKVLRLGIGAEIEVIDGTGAVYAAKLESTENHKAKAKIISKTAAKQQDGIEITLAQCLPKGSKIDFIVEKATELGAASIIPVLSERTVPDISGKENSKLERWNKIVQAAAKQSGRTRLTMIESPQRFSEVIKRANEFDLALFFYELEQENHFKAILNKHANAKSILALIGPEGGFTKEEALAAKASGFIAVSLGKNILRTETAPLTVLSNLQFFYSN